MEGEMKQHIKDWIIHKLGGYTVLDRRGYLDDWLDEKLRSQLSRKKRKTVDVYESYLGTYLVKIRFSKGQKRVRRITRS